MKLKELLDVIDDVETVWIDVVNDDTLYYYTEGENRMLRFFLKEDLLNAKVKKIDYGINDNGLEGFRIEIG